MKKVFQGMIVGAAILGFVGAASAETYELNLYGASAQHKFWNAAVPQFMADSTRLDCQGGVDTTQAEKHGISVGTQCNVDGLANDDTVTIRYSSKNSSYGIGAACGLANYSGSTCPDGEVDMCDAYQACGDAQLTCQPVHVGASDVELTSFTQNVIAAQTFTYDYSTNPDKYCTEDGNQSQEFLDNDCDTYLDGSAKSVVVPFGFFANNGITKYRCTEPGPTGPTGEHYAYPHWGWQCDPSKTTAEGYNPDCIGYFKCVENTCTGGANVGGDCSANGNLDCPDALADTQCEGMPIDNLSRLMVLQIFSSENEDWLDRWSQFGPWYPDAGIVRCMRCAGSGTHATLDMQVFRGDASIMGKSLLGRFYHHKSSSDLTKCVRDNGWPSSFGTPWADTGYAGDTRLAVGYADSDKILKSTSYPGVHIVKYQGVEPARAKIENNEYNFWAAQTLYWNVAEIADPDGPTVNVAPDHTALLNKLIAAAQDASFLNTITPQNMFWTTTGAMACQKSPNERAYPTVVPASSPNYPNPY